MPEYFSTRMGEQAGSYLNSFRFNADDIEPYDLSMGIESSMGRFLTASTNPFAFAAEYGAVPVKASLYLNAARSAWYAGRSIGAFSSLSMKGVFNPERAVWGYKSRTVTGITGKILRSADDIVTMRYAKGIAEGTSNLERSTSFMGKRIYSVAGEAEVRANAGATFLQKLYLQPTNMMDMVKEINPNLHRFITEKGGAEELTKRVTQRMGALTTTPQPGWVEQLVKPGAIGDMRTALLKYQEGTRVSIAGTARDALLSPFSSKRRDALKSTFRGLTEEGSRKKITLWHTSSKRTARNMIRYQDAFSEALGSFTAEQRMQLLQPERLYGPFRKPTVDVAKLKLRKNGLINYLDEPKDIYKILESSKNKGMLMDAHLNAINTQRWLRLGKVVAGVGIGVTVGAAVTKGIVRAAIDIPARLAATARELTRPEFGSGHVITNSRMSTDRQRAVHAIQNAQMNARYLMGSEANLYH